MNRHTSVQVAAAFAIVCLVWGSTFLAIRFAIETIPPFLMAGLRFLSAGAVLYIWARRKAPKPTPIQWRSAAIIGIALLLCSNGVISWAELHVPSGVAALFVAMIPLWFVIIEWLFNGGPRPVAAVMLGLILGFAGVLLLIGPGSFSNQQHFYAPGIIALLVAPIFWVCGSLYSRKAPLPSSQILVAAMEMLAGGAGLIVLGTLSNEWAGFHFAEVSMRSWLSVAYLSGLGSIVAFTAYLWLLRTISPSRVATYAYINPIVALLIGWAIGGERLTPQIFAAAGAILFAVILIMTARSKADPLPAKAKPLEPSMPSALQMPPAPVCLQQGE